MFNFWILQVPHNATFESERDRSESSADKIISYFSQYSSENCAGIILPSDFRSRVTRTGYAGCSRRRRRDALKTHWEEVIKKKDKRRKNRWLSQQSPQVHRNLSRPRNIWAFKRQILGESPGWGARKKRRSTADGRKCYGTEK